MWIGEGPFSSYGYQSNAYLRGVYQNLDPAHCYKIEDVDSPGSSTQYHVVPVDSNGNPLGPPAFETAGQVMYSIWEGGREGTAYNISNAYIP